MSIAIDFSLGDHSSPGGWSSFWADFAEAFPLAFCEAHVPKLLLALGIQNSLEAKLLFEWTIVDNAAIQEFNAQYRHKNEATDVLSFPIYHSVTEALATKQPRLLLGQVVVSAEWAETHCNLDERTKGLSNPLQAYIVDRFLHGTLHCLGQHHDTDNDYETVIAAQNETLAALFPTPLQTP